MLNQTCYWPWPPLFASYHLSYVCHSAQVSRIEQFGDIRPHFVFSPIPQLSRSLLPPEFYSSICFDLEHAVAQWLRHCATNRNVVGSIPDSVIGIFH
jgi:hypothetical protein